MAQGYADIGDADQLYRLDTQAAAYVPMVPQCAAAADAWRPQVRGRQARAPYQAGMAGSAAPNLT